MDANGVAAEPGGRAEQPDLVDRVAEAGLAPGLAAIDGAERARGRDGDKDTLRVARVEKDGVQAHAAGAGLTAAYMLLGAGCKRFQGYLFCHPVPVDQLPATYPLHRHTPELTP